MELTDEKPGKGQRACSRIVIEQSGNSFDGLSSLARVDLAKTPGEVLEEEAIVNFTECLPEICGAGLASIQPALGYGRPHRVGAFRKASDPTPPASGELWTEMPGDRGERGRVRNGSFEFLFNFAKEVLRNGLRGITGSSQDGPRFGAVQRIRDAVYRVSGEILTSSPNKSCEDLRLRQRFRQPTQIQGERGVMEETVPIDHLEGRWNRILFEISPGQLEAAEELYLVVEKRATLDQLEDTGPVG